MGSLLPGWDESAPGVAPRGFGDFSEEEEELGYFAAYNKMKKEQREAGEPPSPGQLRRSSMSLSRRNSLPVSLGRCSLPLTKDSTGPLSPMSHSFKEAAQLQRLVSLPITAGERLGLPTPKALQSPKSPTSGQLSSSPLSSSLDAYKTSKQHEHEVQWWRNLDSAALNEMPDVPHEKDTGYVPQFKVAGQQLHYRGLNEGEREPAASAPAGAGPGAAELRA